jgi:Arc/MetJ-type ribon-helix-helix transcriptional regulator
MGTVRKTITLTDQQDNWITSQIEAGLYINDSECIRDLIRREQERDVTIIDDPGSKANRPLAPDRSTEALPGLAARSSTSTNQ